MHLKNTKFHFIFFPFANIFQMFFLKSKLEKCDGLDAKKFKNGKMHIGINLK